MTADLDPEVCKTDNGSDYKSHEFRLFLDEMGIDQIFCPPFSPQKKPHVERFIGTWLQRLDTSGSQEG